MADNVRRYRIFRKDYPTAQGGTYTKYSTKIGKKLQDGTWDNEFIRVEFHIKGGVNLQHGTDIQVLANDTNLTFNRFVDRQGEERVEWVLVIYDYEKIGVTQNNDPNTGFSEAEDDIPF